MYELILRLGSSHPLAGFTKTHSTVKARLSLHMDQEGRVITLHSLRGSRTLQREYERAFNRHAASWGCASVQTVREGNDTAAFLGGPCACEGANPACADILQLKRAVQETIPGPSQLDEFAFERGRCRGRATYFDAVAPILRAEPAPAASPARRLVAIESVRKVVSDELPVELAGAPLTDLEAETLRVALRLGYYGNPRKSTMDDLAFALGITKSAVCHRLRGVEEKAIRGLFRTQPLTEPAAPRALDPLPMGLLRP